MFSFCKATSCLSECQQELPSRRAGHFAHPFGVVWIAIIIDDSAKEAFPLANK